MNKAQFKRVLKQVNDQHPDVNLTREQKWQVLWNVADGLKDRGMITYQQHKLWTEAY